MVVITIRTYRVRQTSVSVASTSDGTISNGLLPHELALGEKDNLWSLPFRGSVHTQKHVETHFLENIKLSKNRGLKIWQDQADLNRRPLPCQGRLAAPRHAWTRQVCPTYPLRKIYKHPKLWLVYGRSLALSFYPAWKREKQTDRRVPVNTDLELNQFRAPPENLPAIRRGYRFLWRLVIELPFSLTAMVLPEDR